LRDVMRCRHMSVYLDHANNARHVVVKHNLWRSWHLRHSGRNTPKHTVSLSTCYFTHVRPLYCCSCYQAIHDASSFGCHSNILYNFLLAFGWLWSISNVCNVQCRIDVHLCYFRILKLNYLNFLPYVISTKAKIN